jgi:hypothetical protein
MWFAICGLETGLVGLHTVRGLERRYLYAISGEKHRVVIPNLLKMLQEVPTKAQLQLHILGPLRITSC